MTSPEFSHLSSFHMNELVVVDSSSLAAAASRLAHRCPPRSLPSTLIVFRQCWRLEFSSHPPPFSSFVLRSLGSGASGAPPELIVYLGPSSLCHVSAAVLGFPELGSAVT